MSKEEILDGWEEYIAELYDYERNERPEIKEALEGPPITKDEIELVLKDKSGVDKVIVKKATLPTAEYQS